MLALSRDELEGYAALVPRFTGGTPTVGVSAVSSVSGPRAEYSWSAGRWRLARDVIRYRRERRCGRPRWRQTAHATSLTNGSPPPGLSSARFLNTAAYPKRSTLDGLGDPLTFVRPVGVSVSGVGAPAATRAVG